jgi:diguanylate cyclase (GGDEF)-like protein/PAS domain S-box-containing protein
VHPSITPAVQALLSGLYDAAAILDPQMRVIDHNSAFAALTGLRPRRLQELLSDGVEAFRLIGQAEGLDRVAAEACLRERRAMHLAEQQVVTADGETLVVWLTFLPLPGETGEPSAIIQILRDVTGDAQAHNRLKDLLSLTRARADDLERSVQRRTEELRAALEDVTRLSRTDPLTGLLNRRAFTEQAQQALDLAARHQRQLAILMCDLDHFKLVNDEHGHLAGDQVLQATAHVLQSNVRASDRVARLGGEEFAVLLAETDPSSVQRVADRFNTLIRQLPVGDLLRNAGRPQTVSIGVALFPEHGNSLDELLSRADKAMYVAKQSGRDRAVLYEPGMGAEPSVAPSPSKPRVLVAAADAARVERWHAALQDRFSVVVAPSASSALLFLRQSTPEVIVVDEDLPDRSGVELLGETLQAAPGAVRILTVASEDFYLAVRATNYARVDYFMLRSDADTRLGDAIDDGLARREILREQLGLPLLRSRARPLGAHLVDQVLAEQAINFAFQPIVHPDRRRFGLEALCRVPGRFHLGPAELFDAALRSGQIWRLGRDARRMIATLIPRLDPEATLFINLHPAEIEDPQLLSRDHPLYPHAARIVLELTERASIPDFQHFRSHLNRLRDLGYRFAVDDLGAGYASLSAVSLLEPDFIKLDHSLIRNAWPSRRRRGLLLRIVQFANDHGIRVVAEGLETEDDAVCATELGCHLMQGHWFGRPEVLAGPDPGKGASSA